MDQRDRQALDAVIRSLEVLGEACKRLSPEMRRTGFILIHAYDQVDLEEVWMAYQRFSESRSCVVTILKEV
jgi:uncharacterized protein with HEPN domain